MTLSNTTKFIELKKLISIELKTVSELNTLFGNLENSKNQEEKNIIKNQIESLKQSLKKTNQQIPQALNKYLIPNPLEKSQQPIQNIISQQTKTPAEAKISAKPVEPAKNIIQQKPMKIDLSPLEKETLDRLKKHEKKVIIKKERKASKYVQLANKLFSNLAVNMLGQKSFKDFKANLTKANLQFLPRSYISVVLFTTFISIGVAFFLFIFFLFFNIGATLPILTLSTESITLRFAKVFWLLFFIPFSTFFVMYFYPSLEARSAENRIDQELPFAAINMSSIAGSMIDPSKIFSIILTTHEYPYIEKEFIKLLNEINLLGYDLVTALRNSAINSPSKRLSELFNGIATTISSGGDLAEFFSKRAESLLFEYRIEREKRTRAAETFMDIYISVVIAAPMILMLLLMMMKISGLGLQLSTGMITLIMVLGVTIINIAFLTFLHLKQSAQG
jgi:flagellar protein FlaJ